MPRAGVTTQRIIDEAANLADERGLEQITLAALAERLGVRVPSLYKHVASLHEVHLLLADRCRMELAVVMEQATIGRAGPDAVASLARAIRAWARQHPGRYAATVTAHHSNAEPSAATQRALHVFLLVLRNTDATNTDVIHRARTLRSAIHGFIDLELRGGFGLPIDIDESFNWLVENVAIAALSTSPEPERVGDADL